MTCWPELTAFYSSALSGATTPWAIGLALALTTLLLEDVAIAAGVAVATQGAISWEAALLAVAGGIALGDMGLYGLGLAANRVPFLQRKYIDGRTNKSGGAWAHQTLHQRLPSAVLLARVVPGLRLVTYTACGFFRTPLLLFTVWVLLAVTLWTAGLFWLSSTLGNAIAAHMSIPAPLAVALPIAVLALIFPVVRHFKKRRRASTPHPYDTP
jgi:membrane protein DedA with SNARE-associated domain